MSTRSTVYVAVNCASAGIISSDEAKAEIMEHIRDEVLMSVAQELPVNTLEQLSEKLGCGFEVHAGQIEHIQFC